jgi:hypothetical protein
MKNLLLLFVALAVPAFSQTVTIPSQQITIPSQIVPIPSTLPPWVTFNDATETMILPRIELTSGAMYAAGQYLVKIDASSNLTYTPFTGSTSTSEAFYCTIPAKNGVNGFIAALKCEVQTDVPAGAPPANTVTATPEVYPADLHDAWSWKVALNSFGVATVYVRNESLSTANFPETTFVVKVQ